MKALILGNAFSLHDFPAPQADIVFGVNRIFLSELFRDRVTHYCAVDPYLWRKELDNILSLKNCELYYYPKNIESRIKPTYSEQRKFGIALNMPAAVTFDLEKKVFGHGFSSVYPATQVAYSLGATELIVQGVEFGYMPGKPTHFFGDRRKRKKNMDFARASYIGLLQKLSEKVDIKVNSVLKWWK